MASSEEEEGAIPEEGGVFFSCRPHSEPDQIPYLHNILTSTLFFGFFESDHFLLSVFLFGALSSMRVLRTLGSS
jgi:hypothetical protein